MIYAKLRELMDTSMSQNRDVCQVYDQVKELGRTIAGRDIFKREIEIIDGHDSSSYFWIRPVRVIDYFDTGHFTNVSEMRGVEISLEEGDVAEYLTLFLFKHFDGELEANKMRIDSQWKDDYGNLQTTYIKGFQWNLEYNFFTFDSMMSIIEDIKDTVDALSSGNSNEFADELRRRGSLRSYDIIYIPGLTEEQLKEYNDNRPVEEDTEIEAVIDFYQRFIYRMEYMIHVGKEQGYDLISFMGP